MDDFSEFKNAVGDVTPLKIDERVSLNKNQQDSLAVAQRRQAAVTDIQEDPNHLSDNHVEMVKPYDIIQYKKDGVQEGVYRKFRLGKYEIDARLDLHRRTVQQAREEVYRFIADAMKYDLRTLIILHGKGEKEATPALLKSWTNKWLREFDDVIAFHSAQPQHGGTGALYVMLRKSERKKQETREKHRIK
ncbi:MAG: DNA-nicking Smr family endonuclease [Oceanicoccus sp.]|jgi:DNA-nicking Smr family endonuclease